jgi:enterochelin esterase-like enzyme
MTNLNSMLQHARQSGSPVIEGDRATFIWEGKNKPYMMSDLNEWDEKATPFRRVSSGRASASVKSIWSYAVTLPRDAYIEYAFFVPKTKTRLLDSLNRRTVSNGFGSRNNYFYMPEGMPSPFAIRRADVPAGTVTRHRVDTSWLLQDKGMREVHLYKPPVKGAVPLLVVYDGIDYLHRTKLTTMVDNMIAEKRIRPIAMAFLQNGKSRRTVEYFCSDATIAWLDSEILPLALKHLNLLNIEKYPGAYGVLGASAGGLMSMYTGLRMPEIFGKVLCQSGVFGLDSRDFAVVDLIRHRHAQDTKIWMDVGKFEWLLEDNRRMQPILKENGYQVIYHEYSGSHNYTSWRDDLWRGLEEMFPIHRAERSAE